MMLMLCNIALAQDLPVLEAPVRAADRELDCKVKAPLLAEQSRDCDSNSLPPTYLSYLEERDVYADELYILMVAERTIGKGEAQIAADQIAWRDIELAAQVELRQPRPVLEIVGYVVLGSAMTLGAAWGLGQITTAP